MRFKLLTNFVNAYKEKMFLSNKANDGKNNTEDILSAEELKESKMVERNDITLDYEQFMRIYNFEKSRTSNLKTEVMSS